jgi:hypothetical protein
MRLPAIARSCRQTPRSRVAVWVKPGYFRGGSASHPDS